MNHLGDLLSAHLDGELTSYERSRVAEHLQTCDRCRRELDELASARAAVRSLPLLELPVALSTAIGARPDPIPLRRRPVAWVGAAAAAAFAVFVSAAALTAPEPREISPPQLNAVYGAVSSNEGAFTVVKVAGATAAAGGAR